MEGKHIILLVDKSWSMDSYREQIDKGVARFVEKLKQSIDKIYVSIIFFSNEVSPMYLSVPVRHDTTLDLSDLVIEGCTSLYDSVANVLLEWSVRSYEKNILYIVSDGDDTSSKKFSKQTLDAICSEIEKKGLWKIVYCNTDMSNLNVENNINYKISEIEDLLGHLGNLSV